MRPVRKSVGEAHAETGLGGRPWLIGAYLFDLVRPLCGVTHRYWAPRGLPAGPAAQRARSCVAPSRTGVLPRSYRISVGPEHADGRCNPVRLRAEIGSIAEIFTDRVRSMAVAECAPAVVPQ